MERFHSESSQELFSEVARFTSYALRYSPEEIVRLANNRKSGTVRTTSRSTPRIISGLIEESLRIKEGMDLGEGEIFFVGALEDVGQIIKVIAETHSGMDDETVLEVMSDPETIDTIALLALRPAEDMLPYIRTELKNTGNLSPEKSYTINDENLRIDTIGCPAAGYTATDAHAGQVMPLPIFKQLIPWATRVHLLSDEWHDFKRKLENERHL